jgi:hypothetical protein
MRRTVERRQLQPPVDNAFFSSVCTAVWCNRLLAEQVNLINCNGEARHGTYP